MPPSHKRGVFRTFVHRKKTSPREVESLYHKKSPLVNSCGRFFRIFRRPAEERRGGRENLCPAEERRGGRENLCFADARRGERENLRRDTPPMSPAAQRRERRMPQVPADAFLPRAKGRTTKSLRPAAAAPGLPYVHEYTFASIRRRSRLTLFCLFPRRAIMSVPGYAENLPFSRRRWRRAGISANYFVICVVKTTEFGFSETKLSVRCAAADGFTRRRRSVRQTEKKPRR